MNPIERGRRRVAIEAVMVCIVVLLMVQMWLLTATLESFLAGHRETAGPAFAASLVLALIAGGLYLLVQRVDRSVDPSQRPPSRSGPWQIG